MKGNEIRIYDFYEAAYYRMNKLSYYLDLDYGTKVVWVFGPEAKETQDEYRGEVEVSMSAGRFAEWVKETKKEMHHKKEE